MTHLDILVPFCLPPADLAKDLLRELQAPALAMLVSRAASHRDQSFDAFARALPHESWVAGRFGLAAPAGSDSSPPLAAAAMRAFGLAPAAGIWFLLHPVHLHVARDHLVLTDQRRLELEEDAARALFESASELFAESGHALLYGDARNWFLRADDWDELSTATLDAACGHNIDIWMPRGPGERDWRKLQNELQMLWHGHPVNQERETLGQPPVNSVWISGGGPAASPAAPDRHGQSEALDRFAARQGLASETWAMAAAGPGARLEILNQLLTPALAGDWAGWLQTMTTLEREWFSPLLLSLKAGKINTLSLILTHGTHLAEFRSTKRSMGKFWVKPTLSPLTP